jgi:hypothetical protein
VALSDRIGLLESCGDGLDLLSEMWPQVLQQWLFHVVEIPERTCNLRIPAVMMLKEIVGRYGRAVASHFWSRVEWFRIVHEPIVNSQLLTGLYLFDPSDVYSIRSL